MTEKMLDQSFVPIKNYLFNFGFNSRNFCMESIGSVKLVRLKLENFDIDRGIFFVVSADFRDSVSCGINKINHMGYFYLDEYCQRQGPTLPQ